jgi:signal peptidase I
MNEIKKLAKDWLVPIISGVILAFLITKFVFFKATVPTGSMLPTIQLNDQLFVTRIYNFNNIKRGDIIVFNSKELNEKLVKRLIGLPGDTVEVKEDGSVLVNSEKLNEPYVASKGGKSGTYVVPEDKYFFLGDNRPSSLDSRYWKDSYISKKDILGKAQLRVYPFSAFGRLK